MTARWIIGVDGSDAAVVALGWAVRRALEREAELTALGAFHVPAPMALMTAKRGFGVDELGLEATTGHDVDQAIASFADEVVIEPRVEEGQPAHVLVDASEAADLLVVGRSGSGGLRHLVLGSVSRYCVTHAHSPVVVVPATSTPSATERIVVGFDGSDHAAAAVRWALDFAGELATVRVVTAIEAAPWIDPGLAREVFPDEIAGQEAELTAALAAADPTGRADHVLTLADPRRALADASADADLVVVGARGRGRIAAELLGSVATSLLHDATGPVAVVPGT